MNLTEANIESLSNDELNFLAAEAREFHAVGYYGPTLEGGTHSDYYRYDTKAEALAEYVKHWTRGCEEQGFVCGADMEEDDITLCYWKEDWGPLTADKPADGDDGLWGMTFEEWFFKQHPQFSMSVWKKHNSVSVGIMHDTHEEADAYFDGTDEPRLRTMAILETLKKVKIKIHVWAKRLAEDVADATD